MRKPSAAHGARIPFMDECRRAMGASSLSLCHVRNDGDLALRAIAGAAPATAVLRDVAARLPCRSRKGFRATWRIDDREVAIAGHGSDFVVVLLPHAEESWLWDFLAWLAEKLVDDDGAHEPEELEPSRPPALKIPPGMVVGSSAPIQTLMQELSATVSSGMDVLLQGETGTGKELFARAVHASGPHAGGPFVAINCAAIPGELLEAELFGIRVGVATGVDARPGLFARADGGSILLDEISDMPVRLQAKLLRVLQEREVLPLGATHPRKIHLQVISASNRDLAAMAAEGTFRADLYYRLRALQFHIPPLRDRKEDIPTLVLEFVTRASAAFHKNVRGVAPGALSLLQAHDWPGNIRELESEIRRAVLRCPRGTTLREGHFGILKPVDCAKATDDIEAPSSAVDAAFTLRERVGALERIEIERALRNANGNRSHAARLLGITRNGLAGKLRRLQMDTVTTT